MGSRSLTQVNYGIKENSFCRVKPNFLGTVNLCHMPNKKRISNFLIYFRIQMNTLLSLKQGQAYMVFKKNSASISERTFYEENKSTQSERLKKLSLSL